MTGYCLTGADTVIRVSDGAHIPADPLNRDWREYQDWLAGGGEPEPYVAPVEPTPLITRRQARLFLLSIGKTSADVEAAIATISDPIEREAALIEWQDATLYRPDHPLFAQLAPLIGLSIDDLSDAFRSAALM